ncbi:peptidase [Thermothelomyces thermophilus ATCC 42464]|uniref:Peptide hydrolase n=1 Tax=Thermothelomyces thermophilus (strain ATCC 42464 / BCRC 31852 / DSM 1799) TaxID=573729 RepID=G2QNT3_THET4|nr:peptidase [Thermothelomyces thermophilus ATCC 42464]AEO62109.1 peptidase [Thermothelomyces thermophilus ATCC 42464]
MRTPAASLLAFALPALATAGGHGGSSGLGCDSQRPLVSSEKLQSLIKKEDLLAGSQELQDIATAHGGHRAFGSSGHNATVDFLYYTLKALDYYNVTKQPFKEIFSSGTGSLTVDGEDIEAETLTYTPSGSATDKPVVVVANVGCDAADYPAEVAGNIALIKRGTCTFSQKSVNAKAAGAVAAIIYNNAEGKLSGTLGQPFLDYAPVLGITLEAGEALLAKLAGGPVTATLQIDALVEERVTYNVIAETKEGDHSNVLVLGGHTDSVPAGPGINDDGSGTIGMLTVAKALTKFRVKNAVRFAFWSAEEYGLLGSYAYIKSINSSAAELSKIRAYLNFDMIASPNYIYGIYDGDGNAFNLTGPAGSDVIERNFENFFKRKHTPSVPTEFSGRSDYAAFIENGIPSGGLFTGAEVLKTEREAELFGGRAGVAYDVNYHQAGDTVDNLALDAFLLNTKAIADSVATYALSFDGLPRVDGKKRRWDAHRARMLKRSAGSHGHAHLHSGPCGGGASI